MLATAIQPSQEAKAYISWVDFQKKYLTREDAFKYEWINGSVEKTKRTMNQNQYFILDNLTDFLDNLRRKKKINGRFYTEIDTFFLKDIHRRPDIAYFSEEQRIKMANGENQVPLFVIEIISTTDAMNRVQRKMRDYRIANIPVVWQIFPEFEEIHIYRGEKMMICDNDKICTAKPVLTHFQIATKDVFKKPISITL
jgi:Uma2 family endonuclease